MWLDEEEYTFITTRVPLACVDLLIEENKKFLVCRRVIEPCKGGLALPGGCIYKGQTFEEAIYSKAEQELGIKVNILNQLGTFMVFYPKYHAITTVFLCRRKDSQSITLDFQHKEYMWLEDVSNDLEPHVKQVIEIARNSCGSL